MKSKSLIFGALLVLLTLVLAACSSAGPAQQTQAPAAQNTQAPAVQQPAQACPTAAACPEPAAPAASGVAEDAVPFFAEWAASPHNNKEAEAFNHWNEENPAEIPTDCAKCHSTPGYIDYVGADGSAANAVDKAAPIGTTVQCVACHNAVTVVKTSVVFPSGVEITGLNDESRCMECHQGRASKVQVDQSLEKNGMVDDPDKVNPDQSFTNIHYFAAAATLYGNKTHGGYEYDGKQYDSKNDHVAGYNTCIGCHNPHTLEVKVDECAACHTNVKTADDLKNIRMAGSLMDYDGDGNVEEGIAAEIEGLQGMLLTAIQNYGKEKINAPIGYSPAAYPYFFSDPNGDGQLTEDEAKFENAYKSWTGRLLKAAYNYQTSIKDPGQYAHGPKYIIELLYDSIDDLNQANTTKVDLSKAARIDAGHFAGSQEAFRHWDGEEEGNGVVPNTCVKCHTATGLPMFLANNAVINQPASNGLNCATCHSDLTTFTRYEVKTVKMPSGATVAFANLDANLCLSCHQGRESTVSVDNAIKAAGVDDNTVSEKLNFRNPHYFAAGATVFGNDAKGAYQFAGKEYSGQFQHAGGQMNTCVDCHDVHALQVKVAACTGCHANVKTAEDLPNIRMSTTGDFDGDGDATEGLGGEVATMHEKLYAAIQAYAADTLKAPIVYNGAQYPYFFGDANANGQIDEGEKAFASWSPALLRAAYNYQWVAKDPGAFAHNGTYILQVLYDSIQSIGGDVKGMTRAPVKATPAPQQ